MINLAQLIKLRDYVSRYEINPFHYPTQFIRLKRDNWGKLVEQWEKENEAEVEAELESDKSFDGKSTFRWNPFNTKKERVEDPVIFKRNLPSSKDQLRKYFLNQLFPFQLKWATSTLTQVSYTDKKHYFDQRLKFFLQHFPDIYLVMYYPIFNIKKAPVDLDIIIISPIGIEIVTILNEEPGSTIIASDERTWYVEKDQGTKKIISPVISLKRTEHIVESILQAYNLSFAIHKTVLCERSQFIYYQEPYKISLIGEKEYKEWYEGKRRLSGSLKGLQLKVMGALLDHCLSTSVRRPEWEKDDEDEDTPFILGE